MRAPLHGLIAATHAPFHADGSLNVAAVEKQAEHLARSGVRGVFINGTTGECHSLTVEERMALAVRWAEVVRGTSLRLVVHVGSNCLADARALAAHAQGVGAEAVAALAPSYFKPRGLEELTECCADIAAAAPGLPFYYYDIPGMTGVVLRTSELLDRAGERIPNLAGLKFTNPDLADYQRCLAAGGGRFDVPWGLDEYLLAALALGAKGAVGSTYNFAAPAYVRLMAALARGDLAAARGEQGTCLRLIDLLYRFGFIPAAKEVMGVLGVEVGPARLPVGNLTPERRRELRESLEQVGFPGSFQ